MAEELKEETLLQKEAFEEGMKDEDLLTQIEEWVKESDTFYSKLAPIVEQNLEYYFGQQTGVETIRGKSSRAIENRIFMAVETMIPIATSRLPDIEVRSGNEDEQSQMDANELQDIIGYHMERVGVQAKAEQFLRDMIIKRYGVFKINWDNAGNDLDLIVRDPRKIRIPKFGRTIYDLAFIIEELEMSYNQLEEKFGKEKAEKVREESPKVSINENSSEEEKKRKATFTILEVWTNELVVWKAGSIILDKKQNPYFNFKNKKNNFFDLPQKPYVIKSLFETDESMIGDTDYIQQMISIQDNINTRKRQIEDVTAKVSNTPLLIDSDAMSEEQAANITNEAGLIIYGKGAADPKNIRFEQPGQLPNQVFLDLEGSRSAFDNIWGIHSTTRGEREGKETLGGRQLLKAADLGRIDLVARQLERALDEVAGWFTQLIKMFYTEEKSFSIAGEDGTIFINNFTGKRVANNVKLRVMAGSTLPKDEITQRQEAIQLWQLQAIGIRTLYKRLKMPNVQAAVDDYIETQSGAILQRGTQGGGTTVLGQQSLGQNQPPTVQPQV